VSTDLPAPDGPSEPVVQSVAGWRAERVRIFWIWLVLTGLLVVFSLTVPARLMGPPASPTMHSVESTMTLFSVAASPVAALVWAIALYSLLRWRSKGRPTADGPAIRGHAATTVAWAVTSTVLCVFLLVWGMAEMIVINSPAEANAPLVVDVTGQQWVWTFSYPSQGNVESDQLYLPVDRPVIFHVTSKDVIHSFWVVQMGIKIDANPGETTKTSVMPDKIGVFDVRCAELCGLRHAEMQTSAHVVSASDFNSWLSQNGGHS
jgi:cytochrome c oxidase subunit 2